MDTSGRALQNWPLQVLAENKILIFSTWKWQQGCNQNQPLLHYLEKYHILSFTFNTRVTFLKGSYQSIRHLNLISWWKYSGAGSFAKSARLYVTTLRVPKLKFWDHFYKPKIPKKLWNRLWFKAFSTANLKIWYFFGHFWAVFPLAQVAPPICGANGQNEDKTLIFFGWLWHIYTACGPLWSPSETFSKITNMEGKQIEEQLVCYHGSKN